MATPNRLIRFFLSILYLIVSTLIIVNLAQRVIGRMAYVVVCCIIFAILDVLRGMDHFIIRTSKRYGLWDYSSSFAFFFLSFHHSVISSSFKRWRKICLQYNMSSCFKILFLLSSNARGKKTFAQGLAIIFPRSQSEDWIAFFFHHINLTCVML